MVLIDANAILRIILNDNEDMAKEAVEFIRENQVLVRNEVLVEIVYVLQKVYKVDRTDICTSVTATISTSNVNAEHRDVVLFALNTFSSKNLDFVDCLLYAYHFANNDVVFTFDKDLKKLMAP